MILKCGDSHRVYFGDIGLFYANTCARGCVVLMFRLCKGKVPN